MSRSRVIAVLGGQWGDEGKGKIVDLLSGRYGCVVRYQGGNNAGHTVKVDDRVHAFHLIPSGILHPGTACVLGNGVVVHPPTFLEEVDGLHELGIDTLGRLWVSDRAHLVMPYHPRLDIAREVARGDRKIGTTSRGIGPAYEDKAARTGLRVGELRNEKRFRERATRNLVQKNRVLEALGAEALDVESVLADYLELGERMAPYITDSVALLRRALAEERGIVLEGAQGAMLDLDHGTYPFVTSSSPSIGGAVTGSGIGPARIDEVLMVLKAYTTRIGTGPFPTELDGATGERIREAGNEYGTTTGRPRRCGWFDLVVARHAARLNDCTAVALTLLDVLDGFEELRVCTGYRIDAEETDVFPADPEDVESAEPVYESFGGWEAGGCRGKTRWDDLPEAARRYVAFLEDALECRIALVSTGPGRAEFLRRPGAERFLS